jgi:hypothetical protein
MQSRFKPDQNLFVTLKPRRKFGIRFYSQFHSLNVGAYEFSIGLCELMGPEPPSHDHKIGFRDEW